MRNNNKLPTHRTRKTSTIIKEWHNQPARAARRKNSRKMKERRVFPRPIRTLKPVVRCPTVRYNRKERAGRGFTPQECEAAGLDMHYARTIGISVDTRRRNSNKATFDLNVERLTTYRNRLTFYKNKREAIAANAVQHRGLVMPILRKAVVVSSVSKTDFESL